MKNHFYYLCVFIKEKTINDESGWHVVIIYENMYWQRYIYYPKVFTGSMSYESVLI